MESSELVETNPLSLMFFLTFILYGVLCVILEYHGDFFRIAGGCVGISFILLLARST